MDQSRRDLMKFGGLGFLGIATGIAKTPEGILLPHDKIVTIQKAKQEAMILASGYITDFSFNTQIDQHSMATINMRVPSPPIIRSIDTDITVEFMPETLVVSEEFYNGRAKRIVIYR